MERVLYAELTPHEFQRRVQAAPIAYLPLGTLEWHGPHLPLGSDGIQSQGFFEALARRAGGVVLPMLFVGPDFALERQGGAYYGMDVYGFPDNAPEQLPGSAYWVDEDLFAGLLTGIMRQLKRAGFRVVAAHGHAPSTQAFLALTGEWERLGLKTFVCWREDESDGLGIQTDHAAANETSLVMALRGDLVAMDQLPVDRNEPILAIDGDDPRELACADRGRQAIQLQLDRMEAILRAALDNL